MWVYIYLFLALGSYGTFYWLNRDLMNPPGIFLFIWYTCSAICNLYLSDLQNVWSTKMHLVVVLSGLCFFAGGFFAYPRTRFQVILRAPTTNTFRFLSRSLFWFAFTAFMIEWKINGFHITLLSLGDSGDLKSQVQGVPFLHYGTILIPLCGVLAVYELLNDGKKLYVFFVMFVAFVLYSIGFGLSRGDMFMYLGAILFMSSRYKRISSRTIFRFGAVGIAVAVGFMLMRVSGDDSVVYTSTDNKFVSIFYSYIAMNYENLRQLVDGDTGYHLLGNATFRFFYTLIGIKDALPIKDYDVMGVFNAETYLYPYYHDYMMVGITLFPFLIGFIVTCIYKVTAWSRNTYYIILMATLQKAIYVNFFGDYFISEMVVLWPYLIAFFLAAMSKYRLTLKSTAAIVSLNDY